MSFDVNLTALIAAAVLILVLIAVLWYAAQSAKPSPDLPPGPPTGAVAMERKVAATVAMIAGLGLLLLAYGLKEPAREVDAQNAQLDTSIGRGIANYTTLCYQCHGEDGQGALVPQSDPSIPEQLAPPLNRPDLRPTDPDARSKTYDDVDKTITRGIANSPMPSWGQSDGGPLLDEQINELTLVILNGDRVVTYNGYHDSVWNVIDSIIKENVSEGTATLPKQPDVENQPFYQTLTDQQKQGTRVILQYGCGGCHTIPNIPGAQGTIGPNEAGVASRKTIAGGAVPNNSVDDLAKWIQNPQALKPGTAMPTLGLSPDDAAAAAAYLYTLQ